MTPSTMGLTLEEQNHINLSDIFKYVLDTKPIIITFFNVDNTEILMQLFFNVSYKPR